jgi:hypothetical protein
MGTQLEKTKTKKGEITHCGQGCPGQLRLEVVTRVFRRTGSLVEVVIEHIPANTCPLCGRAFFARPVVQEIDRILLPFHGKHAAIPDLPPAKVFVDFTAAQRRQAA